MPAMKPSRLPAIILPLLVIVACLLPNRLDLWFQDQQGQLFANNPGDDVVIVAIDEKSLARLGRWPWPRELLAGALDKLHNTRAVGLDIILAEPSANPESDYALTQAMLNHGRVFLPAIAEVGHQLQETHPLPAFSRAAKGVGMIDYPLDTDGLIRRTYLKSGLGSPRWPAFTALLAGKSATTSSPPGQNLSTEWVREQERLLPYLSNRDGYPTLSFVDVLDSQQPIAALSDKTILIGATAAGLGDIHLTPIHRGQASTSGVLINAAAISALQKGDLVRPVSLPTQVFILLLLTLLWQRIIQPRNREQSIYIAIGYSAVLIISSLLAHYLLSLLIPIASLAILIILTSIADFNLQQRHFKRLAFTDKLTGLANRHHFDDRFLFCLQQAQLEKQPLALLLIDVDHFKRYNDHYGHAAGDDALKKVAQIVQKVTHSNHDLAARIGGEEFAILLPGTRTQPAIDLAAELRLHLLSLQLPHEKSPLGRLSCSIGILSEIPDLQETTRSLFEKADQALYGAKRNGRDCAQLAGSLSAQEQASD